MWCVAIPEWEWLLFRNNKRIRKVARGRGWKHVWIWGKNSRVNFMVGVDVDSLAAWSFQFQKENTLVRYTEYQYLIWNFWWENIQYMPLSSRPRTKLFCSLFSANCYSYRDLTYHMIQRFLFAVLSVSRIKYHLCEIMGKNEIFLSHPRHVFLVHISF